MGRLIDIVIGAVVLFEVNFFSNIGVYNYQINYAETQAELWGKTEIAFSSGWEEYAEKLKQDKRYFIAYFRHSNIPKEHNSPPYLM